MTDREKYEHWLAWTKAQERAAVQEIDCEYCGARAGDSCVTRRLGNKTQIHSFRWQAELQRSGYYREPE